MKKSYSKSTRDLGNMATPTLYAKNAIEYMGEVDCPKKAREKRGKKSPGNYIGLGGRGKKKLFQEGLVEGRDVQ